MTTFERIELKLAEKGIKPSTMSKELGFSSGLFSQWKSGAQEPSAKSLEKIAKYFNVSIDYLKGNNEKSTEDLVKTYLFGTNEVADDIFNQVKQYAVFLSPRKEGYTDMDNNHSYQEPYSHVREVFADRFIILDYIISKTSLSAKRKMEIRENGIVNEEEFNIIQEAANEELFEYDLWQLLRPTFERKIEPIAKFADLSTNSDISNAARNGSEPKIENISNIDIKETEEKTKSQDY